MWGKPNSLTILAATVVFPEPEMPTITIRCIINGKWFEAKRSGQGVAMWWSLRLKGH
jgi:hypothetical protein